MHLLRSLINRHHCFSAGSVVSLLPLGASWFCSGLGLVQYFCVTIQTGHWIAPLLQINASESSAASESGGASSVYKRPFVFSLSKVPLREQQQHAEVAARKSVSDQTCIFICGLMGTEKHDNLSTL